MDRRTFIASTTALAAFARPGAAAQAWPLGPLLDAAVARAMALDLTPGLALAVYSPQGTYARGFGFADAEVEAPATADTAFYVASSTKGMTALALAIQAERGKLDLDTTLAAYAPDAGFPDAIQPDRVRLRDLLTHTSGIENDPIGYRLAYTGDHDPQTLWRLLATSHVNAKAPLGKFRYTNVGYNIATILADRRLGVRWQDLLQRELFTPARLNRTSATLSRAQAGRWPLARPYGLTASGRFGRLYLEKTDRTMQSAGGVVMTARNAARWLELMIEGGRLDGRQVVPAAAIRAVCTPQVAVGETFGEYSRDRYAMGWYVGAYRGEAMLHDFGSFAGFRAHVSFLPDRRIGVAAFANDATVAFPLVDALASYVYDASRGSADAAPRYEAALAAMQARRQAMVAHFGDRAGRPWMLTRPMPAYAGRYEHPQFGRIAVSAEGPSMRIGFGVMHALAEPFTEKDAIRVELAPGEGEVIAFAGEGARPASLRFAGRVFTRLDR